MEASGSHYTPTCHLIGMLDRDQRTAKMPTYTKNQQDLNATCLISANCDQQQEQCRSRTNYRKTCSWPTMRSMQRLKQVLVVGTYLLIVIPNVLSAPTNMGKFDSSHPEWQKQPKWIPTEDVGRVDVTDSYRSKLASAIATQARMARDKAKNFFDEYCNSQFDQSAEMVKALYKEEHFDWLPVPKQDTGDNMDTELVDLYQDFQKIAVGFEQIIWHYKDQGVTTQKNNVNFFQKVEGDLKAVLTELHTAAQQIGLQLHPDVQRDNMPNDIRDIDETARRKRDFVIYRDYIDMLEYTARTFEAIGRRLS